MTMCTIQGKNAVVIGGSSGVGRATVQGLVKAGARVTAVARGADRLRALEAEGVSTIVGDATNADFVGRLIRDVRPELLVHAAGIMPRMGRVDELDWESFSETWNADVKASFLLIQQALTLPLAPGSSVVLVSS